MSNMEVSVCCLLAVILATVSGQAKYCPRDGIQSKLYECLIVSTDQLSWYDAIYKCELLGGSLAKIATEAQQQHVESNLGTIRSAEYYWIGLNDIKEEDQFVWPDGTTSDYISWRKGQYSQPNGHRSQNCIAIGTWGLEDKDCHQETYRFICEINSDQTPEPSVSIEKGSKLPNYQAKVVNPESWTDRALMVYLTVEDESVCVLHCLYTAGCVRVAYTPDRPTQTNCLLYRVAEGSEAPLWNWRVYELEDTEMEGTGRPEMEGTRIPEREGFI